MIVVTGAAGFVGSHLVRHLRERGFDVRPVTRTASPDIAASVHADLLDTAAWPPILAGKRTLVHLAAYNPPFRLVPRRGEDARFTRVNVEAAARLARDAAAAGVEHVVYLSSMRVYGAASSGLIREDAPLAARDAYGRSKHEAEEALRAALAETGTALTILRPPLIYGRDHGGVVALVDRAVRLGLPLPFKGVKARRSLAYVGNVVAAIETCARKPEARGSVFNVSDGSPWSYADLAVRLASLHGREPRLVPPPPLGRLGRIPGPLATVHRLLQPFACDDRSIRRTLDWLPPVSTSEALRLAFAPQPGVRNRA